jgi:hypothetical protein
VRLLLTLLLFLSLTASPAVSQIVPSGAGGIGATILNVAGTAACGRLTLQSGVAVSLTDQAVKSTVFYTPYRCDQIGLFSGSSWSVITFTEVSLALASLTRNANYDVYGFSSGGALTLELSAAWASDTARTDALATQNGVQVKASATTRRLLGTIRTSGTNTTEDTLVRRFVWNQDNRVGRKLFTADATSHSYNGGYRQWNAATANQVNFVTGLAEDPIVSMLLGEQNAALGIYAIIAQGLDSVTVPVTGSVLTLSPFSTGAGSNLDVGASATAIITPQIGFHFIAAMENTITGGANTFYDYTLQGMVMQ